MPENEKREATDLVQVYLENVARLYQIPVLELQERLKVKLLEAWGNG